MKIAIIGGGISGLSAAYYLQQHDIKVYEAADRIGGHTATVDVEIKNQHYAVDTGFIVYNDWTYPNFIELMDELGVESQPTEMSFSVRCEDSGLEYGGNNLNSLFAQRRNLLRPSFHFMLRDILRFNREAVVHLEARQIDQTTRLGEYLDANNYGEAFKFQYLLPMGCAIWSASTESMLDFPLLFFIRFFKNHGLLSVNHRPQWRVIKGGSSCYLQPLVKGFESSIVTGAKISGIRRTANSVVVTMANGYCEEFDQLVFACHSDQALQLLDDASNGERIALAAIPYQSNRVILHSDENLLPRNRRTWSSWNYWLRDRFQERAVLSYNMNILQGLTDAPTLCVTLNASDSIASGKIINSFEYSHPQFSLESVSAARQIETVNGANRTWYAGAYLGNGFHEDGVSSGKKVAASINLIGQQQTAVKQKSHLRLVESA
ncbi:MAG: putative NAD/FAD-binding protein [Planctomycetota bacterium]|jgi:predicted NAD/FAD-binding protein